MRVMTHSSFFRPTIDRLAPYLPGEQPEADAKVIKLNTNENPYPPSPAALAALRDIGGELLRRYPHPFARVCREAAAEVYGFDPSWILIGNGSDDLLTMLMRSVAETARAVAYPMPTYVLYRTLAHIQDAPIIEVPFDDDYNLPVSGLVGAGAAMTLVANPNSPSGTHTRTPMLAELAASVTGLLVIDEAYAEFADEDALELVRRLENVIVLRSLSKSHSLAGLRLGIGVARPALIEGLSKVKDSYNVDAVAARLGAAALRDTAHTRANVERIRASRAALAADLVALGCRVWPSQANFILARPPGGDAERLYLTLKAQRILVRYFKEPRLDDKLRITVGTDVENAALVGALRRALNP
jgi:histidinol-phosphate aminotransferase